MKSIKEILYLLSLPIAILLIMAFKEFADDQKLANIKSRNADKSFAVVELFTSEGCWSCPPADGLIAKLEKNNHNKKLFIMAFHVDYWDHQGWKDRFSKSKFTERQKQYAKWMNLSTLYTPQVVINGKTEMVGSETGKVLAGIQSAMLDTHTENLKLKVEGEKGRNIQVSYTSTSPSKNSDILLALVQKEASSQISAGENAGKALSHVQIVRELQSRSIKAQDSFSFKLPDMKNQWEIIAFEQDQKSGEIIDATSISL
ncbi:DUF1223 domain-containing protein [Chryseobacterium arthrosphaerae]|uniref:DUF1223 domain-containing protein n=1 Tax=Chryseobacterium arthrosphaerae TaxID=651561 RepID=UPI0023E15351|nr:DUF1223 domain-containing protein [Chryseobacterium arthrosphaerae]WES98739.1 DUF1223 domain-containing protein [Chryseobacterium arthrosphaerae]